MARTSYCKAQQSATGCPAQRHYFTLQLHDGRTVWCCTTHQLLGFLWQSCWLRSFTEGLLLHVGLFHEGQWPIILHAAHLTACAWMRPVDASMWHSHNMSLQICVLPTLAPEFASQAMLPLEAEPNPCSSGSKTSAGWLVC